MAYELYPVVSSAIASLQYDSETETCAVTFQKGGSYLIEGIPEIEVYRWANDRSPGGYFNSNIKGRY